MSRPFSTASIQLIASEFEDSASSNTPIEQVLQKLLQIDHQIDRDFNALKTDLANATCQLDNVRGELENERRKKGRLEVLVGKQDMLIGEMERERGNGEGKGGKGFRSGLGKENVGEGQEGDWDGKNEVLAEMDSVSLCVLLRAREEAYRSQQILVERLKGDNLELKETYDRLWERYQQVCANKNKVEKGNDVNDRIEHLSFSVQEAGRAAWNVATRVEERLLNTVKDVEGFGNAWRRLSCGQNGGGLLFGEEAGYREEDEKKDVGDVERKDTPRKFKPGRDEYEADEFLMDRDMISDMRRENQRLNTAGIELMKSLMLQQEAHDKLRSTVVELTKELERIEPASIQEGQKCIERMESTEKELKKAKSKIKEKDSEIADLKRQLKKVLAEYEAVSIAHSYSNAELSKIRATNRAKTNMERHKNDPVQRHGNGGDKLHHRRNHHFR